MSRRRAVIVAVLIAMSLPSPQPAAAQGLVGARVETAIPLATAACAGPVLSLACGVGEDAVGAIGDIVGAGAGVVGGAAMDGLSSWVGEGAAWLVRRVAGLVERSTRPDLGAGWFTRQYSAMLALALVLALAFLLVALAHAALRQDPAAAARAAFVALPLALCGSFAAVALVEIFLAATDEAALIVTRRTAGDSREFFDDLANAITPSVSSPANAIPGFLALLAALFAALLCMVVWIELILREAAIYLAVAFLPLSLAAMVWERTAHLSRRLLEGLAAVIAAKLTIAVAVAFAASAMGNARPGSGGGMTAILAGCSVLFLAALSPWVLLRLIPLAGDHVGIHRGAVRRATRSAPGAGTAATVVRTGMRTAFATPAGPVATTAAVASSAAPAWRPSLPAPTLAHSSPAVPSKQPERTGGSDVA